MHIFSELMSLPAERKSNGWIPGLGFTDSPPRLRVEDHLLVIVSTGHEYALLHAGVIAQADDLEGNIPCIRALRV